MLTPSSADLIERSKKLRKLYGSTSFGTSIQAWYIKHGTEQFTAGDLADLMWPNARRDNRLGQSFNLCAGLAGRALRKWRGCAEVRPRVWEVVPEYMPDYVHEQREQYLTEQQNERNESRL